MIQCAYWFRLMRVPVAVRKPNIVASQVVLFLARLSFIFGSALFGLVFFRHLPELEIIPGLGFVIRGALFVTILFSLFCFAMEWERLGRALESGRAG